MSSTGQHLIDAASAMREAEQHLVSAVSVAGPADADVLVFIGALQKILTDRVEAMVSPSGAP